MSGVRRAPPPERDPHLVRVRSLAAQARRIVSDGEVASDPRRLAAGWVRRFVADRARAEEALRLYQELGFEAVADPIRPEDQPPGCYECRLWMALQFRVLYTRRPPFERNGGSRPAAPPRTEGAR